MIRVNVEIWPGGDPARREAIAGMSVWNETYPEPDSTYGFRYATRDGVFAGAGVAHRRADDVWKLIRAVLNHSEPDPEYCKNCHCHLEPARG